MNEVKEFKAKTLLSQSKSNEEIANNYFPRLKTKQWFSLQQHKEEIDSIKDQIAQLERFELGTNLNEGKKAMTLEECNNNFTKIFELKFQLEIMLKEYGVKEKSFKEYFGEVSI